MRLETKIGVVTSDAAIITVPSSLLTKERLLFAPELPEKIEAAAGLPLGLADKLFLSLSNDEEFERDSRLFGRTDRSRTGVYHFRPFGRPQIEAYKAFYDQRPNPHGFGAAWRRQPVASPPR